MQKSYLFGWNGFVDRIGVAKIIGNFRFVRFTARWVFLSNECRIGDGLFKCVHHFIAWFECAFFVIVACEVVSSISSPVLLENVFDTLAGVLYHWQPCEASPNAILFTNVIWTGSVKIEDDFAMNFVKFKHWYCAKANYPKLSSPHKHKRLASIKLPKYFQPVGTSKHSLFCFAATKSTADAVGILLANPVMPFFLKYGIHSR